MIIDFTIGRLFAIQAGYSPRIDAREVRLFFNKKAKRSADGRLWSEWSWAPSISWLPRWRS